MVTRSGGWWCRGVVMVTRSGGGWCLDVSVRSYGNYVWEDCVLA
jgi:hypothetical protein